MRGNAMFALGPNYLTDSLSSYDKAISLDSKFAVAFFAKAEVFIATGQYENALHCLDEGLKVDETNSCAWCKRGATLNRLGKNEEAYQSFDKAIKLSPPKECSLILLNAALVQATLEHVPQALELVTRALKISPEDVNSLNLLGQLLYASGKEQESLSTFEKALKFKKDDAEIDWAVLATLYRKNGKEKEALAARQKHNEIKRLKRKLAKDN